MRHDIRQLTEYIKKTGYVPNTFAEIGSRDGHDTRYIQQYWNLDPNNCFIFEAHPGCFDYIKKTYPQYHSFNVAVSNKTAPVTFYAAKIGEESNVGISSVLDRDNPGWKADSVTIDGWRMDDIINQLDLPILDVLKIDVEGLGLEVLQGFGKFLSTIKFVQVELETVEVWKGQTLHSDVVQFMDANGFKVAEDIVLSHNQNDTLFTRK